MPNPSIRSNPFTFRLERKNKQALIRQYQLILTGAKVVETAHQTIEQREEESWEASEWTLGNTLRRIVGYGLTLFFLFLGAVLIYERSWEGILPMVASIGICLTYVRNDLQVIREKNRKKKLGKKENSLNS